MPPKPITNDTITIAEVDTSRNEANPRAAIGVRDTNGRWWKVWPDKWEQIQLKVSGSYVIGYTSESYRGKNQNIIIGAQRTQAPAMTAPAAGSREIDIVVNGLAHCARLVELAEAGDRVAIAQILDTLEDGWKLHKQEKQPRPAQRQKTVNSEVELDSEMDDGIPY